MTVGIKETIASQLEVLEIQIDETKELSENLGLIVKSSLDQTEQNFTNQFFKDYIILIIVDGKIYHMMLYIW